MPLFFVFKGLCMQNIRGKLASNPPANLAHAEPLRLPPFTLFAPEDNQSSALALEPFFSAYLGRIHVHVGSMCGRQLVAGHAGLIRINRYVRRGVGLQWDGIYGVSLRYSSTERV